VVVGGRVQGLQRVAKITTHKDFKLQPQKDAESNDLKGVARGGGREISHFLSISSRVVGE